MQNSEWAERPKKKGGLEENGGLFRVTGWGEKHICSCGMRHINEWVGQ